MQTAICKTFSPKYKLFLLGLLVLAITSCNVLNPSRMLRTPKDFKFDTFADSLQSTEYRIAPNDELSFSIYTHNGEKMVELMSTSGGGTQAGQSVGLKYMVEHDGMVKLPIIQRVKIGGMTLREAETFLEGEYANYLNKPFVQLKVTNNRVIVFPGGDGGTAKVVSLQNSNTTLFEALAMSGGIVEGKAHNIKLIRGDLKNPKIYKIDLSTVDGIKQANLVLQANDIIYVEPRAKVPQRILTEITPYLSLITTGLLIYGLFK